MNRPLFVCLLALLVGGCETAGEKEVLGGVLGAAGGGLLGSQFGSGSGQLAATAVGVVAGLLLGSSVGQSLDKVDQLKQHEAANHAFETLPSGSASSWQNPDSGNSGSVTPTRTYQRSDGGYCREFTQTISIGGKAEQGYGTACRQPDGSWKIVG